MVSWIPIHAEARQREAQQSHELHEARRRLEQLVGSGGGVGWVEVTPGVVGKDAIFPVFVRCF